MRIKVQQNPIGRSAMAIRVKKSRLIKMQKI